MAEVTDFAADSHTGLDPRLAPPLAGDLHAGAIGLRGQLTVPAGWQVADLWLQSGGQRVGGLQVALQPLASATPAVLAALAASVAGRPLPAGHATAESPAASVGRWRRESPDWQATATARLAEHLAAFGYLI